MGARPTRRTLQPEATGAGMEVTKCLKPPDSGHEFGDCASVQAATRVNAEQTSKRTMCRAETTVESGKADTTLAQLVATQRWNLTSNANSPHIGRCTKRQWNAVASSLLSCSSPGETGSRSAPLRLGSFTDLKAIRRKPTSE